MVAQNSGGHSGRDIPEFIPYQLKERPQWVMWRRIVRNGKPTKPLYQLEPLRKDVQGRLLDEPILASTTDSTTWGTFDFAYELYDANGYGPSGYDGIGFVFSSGDPFAGIDLDNCLDPQTGEIEPWAQEIIDSFVGYKEMSPSETGIHIIVRGKVKDALKRPEIEIYSQERYFTITGVPYDFDEEDGYVAPEFPDQQKELNALLKRYRPSKESANGGGAHRSHGTVGEIPDELIIEKAKKAKNGQKFQRLMDGDLADYGGDHSAADEALVWMLWFWTQDEDQIRRIHESSGLNRDKSTDRLDYLDRSIRNAAESGMETYDWARARDEHDAPEDWPDPRPIEIPMPGVAKLKEVMLPEAISPWVYDAAERMDMSPPDFMAAGAIVSAATLLGRKIGIRPKAMDDWLVVPNLWGGLVGIPASLKTPALEAALKPLKMLAADARQEFEKAHATYELDQMLIEAQRAALKDELKTTAKKLAQDKATTDALQVVRDKLEALEDEEQPTPTRYETNDATQEKIAEILAENPKGILVHRDELMGWLRSLDRQGREGDRAFFLEAWNGTSSYNVDRIGRGYIHVPALCLSLLGGIQPGPLKRYVVEALEEDIKADGLLQRFQVLVWPDLGEWEAVDRWPDTDARDLAYKALKGLAELDPDEFGATPEEDGIPYVRFTEEAQEVFDSWRSDFEPRLRKGELPSALESHLLKYRSLFASLALIFEALDHVADGKRKGAVGKASALRACLWCEYLESHAHRLYSPALHTPESAADNLLRHIYQGDVKNGDTLRSIYHYDWTGLNTAEQVGEAVRVLEEHGWVRRETVKPSGRGRPSERLILHPELRR